MASTSGSGNEIVEQPQPMETLAEADVSYLLQLNIVLQSDWCRIIE